jgi:UDP-2,4-diacetamido-2,4,6-trideoxy-beta-L-altropyranose hydrolase
LKPRVFIRTDGSRQIGLGHLVRCIALAHMIKEVFEVGFVCKEIPEKIFEEIRKLNFGFQKISGEDEFLSNIKPDSIIVLDGYNFGLKYQKAVKSIGCKLVCIDDVHSENFVADVIINHSIGIRESDYNAMPCTILALGPDYALLRPAYLDFSKERRRVDTNESFLICFGGSDNQNKTRIALAAALKFPQLKKIRVVTGEGYDQTSSLNEFISKYPTVSHYHSITDTELSNLMATTDLAIVPCSGILTEVLAVGNRIISGMYTDNQKLVYSNYKKAGFFIDAGDFNENAITDAIDKALNIKSDAPRAVIDGKSGTRILDIFCNLNSSKELVLRRVNIDDLDVTFQWATNSQIRLYSYTEHVISYEEHSLWFHNKLDDNGSIYLVAELNSQKIGSVRFDVKGEEAVISYLLDPEFHGKGLGKAILCEGILFFNNVASEYYPEVIRLVGYVMSTNEASIKIFEKLRFEKIFEAGKLRFQFPIH